jgi:NAD(P)-dependent dehydrogenase (short-subunit alcohol dehydrogenase family)
MQLMDQVAIITGSARGIGRETALSLAREGASIVVADINEAGAQDAAAEIEGLGQRAIAVQTDVAHHGQVQEMVQRAIDTFGRIDILVNNAGTLILDSRVLCDQYLNERRKQRFASLSDVVTKLEETEIEREFLL